MKNRRNRNRRSAVNVELLEGRLLLSAAPQFTVKVVGGGYREAGFATQHINDSGQIAFETVSNNSWECFLSAADGNGSPVNIGHLNGFNVETRAFYVWPDGRVSGVGYTYGSEPNDATFISGPNGQSPLQATNIPIASHVSVEGANSLGQLVPYYLNGTSGDYGYGFMIGESINDSGYIVGSNNIGPNGPMIEPEAYLFSSTGTPIKDLGFGGIATGINNNGDIVGSRTSIHIDGVLYKNGQLFNLNDLVIGYSGHISRAGGISDNGRIAAEDDNGNILLLTPITQSPITPTITWPTPADIVYGTPLSSTQLDATANVPGTFTYSVPEGTVLHAGAAQSLVATFTPDDLVHYTTATATASISVLPATPTITWAKPYPINSYGSPLSSVQLNATANIPGTFTYTPSTGTQLHAGMNQTLTATFTPDDTTDYTTVTATNSIDVYPSQFMPAVYLWANHNHSLDVTSVPYGTTINAQSDAPDTQPATVRFTLKNSSGTIISDVTTTPSYGIWAIGPDLVLPAGSYTYVVKVTTTADWYQVQDSIHQFTVTQAPLTITANNATKVLGQPNPLFTGTITGLVNNDTDVATYSTTATTNSPAGTYAITPSLTDSNYNITFVNGTLTVVPPTISLANGVVTINGQLDSGSVATVSFDQTTGNVKVVLNGYTVQYARESVRQINYIGSPNGHDTYSNGTNLASSATLYGGNNTCMAGPGANYWTMYGTGNSIRDDGGVNYVYRHGYAVSETGTGLFVNLS